MYSLGTSKLVKENTFNVNYFYLRKLKPFMEHLGKKLSLYETAQVTLHIR